MADLLVSNARIVDGTGAPARPGSVVVTGDLIERILPPDAPEPGAVVRFEAAGRVAAPGFVDVHSHSDVTPFVEPTMDSMLRQGVTTLVVGNCGGSAFPFAGADDAAGLAGAAGMDLGPPWGTFAEYLERVEACRPALNLAALVGHGTLREATMADQRRAPTREELTSMRRTLEGALEQGAVGLSSGLIYAPGLHATTEEIISLASALGPSQGLYASHVRGEGETVLGAVAECIEIGRRAGVPAHVSHLKVEGRSMWGRAGDLLALIDDERATGAHVTADQYPYTAWETELSSTLPPWVTPAELASTMTDPARRERLRRSIHEGEPGLESVGPGVGWDRILVGSHMPEPGLTGRSIAGLAEERGVETFEVIAQLILADPHTGMLGHAMHEEDVRAIVARRDVFVATDGLAVSPGGPLGPFAVHPRYYGTFPRMLGRYTRDESLLPLEAAVRKMTSLPADRFSLAGRGRIEPGAFADLVVFDPERVIDRATYEEPHTFPDGIELVVVNGRVAWDGRPGERAGRALRRGTR